MSDTKSNSSRSLDPATKTLIFDFDGTIADSRDALIALVNKLAQELGYKDANLTAQMLEEKPIRTILQDFNISLFRLPCLVRRIKTEMSKHVEYVKPFKGIVPILDKLKDLGFNMHIITSNSKENVQKFLEKNSIYCFDTVYAGSSIFGKYKVIDRFLHAFEIEKMNALYIGDEVRDIEAAHKSGIKIVSVSWGFNSQRFLQEHNPDFLARTPHEMLTQIELWNGLSEITDR